MSKKFGLILKIVVAIVLLFWFLHQSNLTEILVNLHNLSLVTIILVFILGVTAVAINAVKWRLLVPELSWFKLFQANLIGKFYSTLLPGQLSGEIAKTYILSKDHQLPAKLTSSVIVDKMTGFLGAVVITGLLGLNLSRQHFTLPLFLVLLFGFAIFGLFIILLRSNLFLKILAKLVSPLERMFPNLNKVFIFIREIATAWQVYAKQGKILLASVFYGLVYQIFSIAITMVIAYSFNLSISFIDWCWIWAILSLVLFLPITVAGLGLREGTLVGILGTFGVKPEIALALSFSLLGLQVALAILGGLIELKRWYYA